MNRSHVRYVEQSFGPHEQFVERDDLWLLRVSPIQLERAVLVRVQAATFTVELRKAADDQKAT